MKNTNKHLDDLFAAARQQEPIISEENAQELLRKSERMQTLPFIFSMKGIIMSTIGLSLAAFIGYLALSSSPQTPVIHSSSVTVPVANLFAHSTAQNVEVPQKKNGKKENINIGEDDEAISIPPTPPLPPIPPLPPLPSMISTPVKVIGIKPIPLALDKYEKMGLTKKDDGTITFSQKNEKGKIFTMGFPKNSWGIIIGGKDLENAVSDAPRFAPLIVTDTKGNKRLMQFSSDKDGMKTRSMEIHAHGSDNEMNNEETSKIIGDAVNIMNLQVGGEDADIDKLTVGKPDSIPGKKMSVQMYVNVDKRETDTSMNGKSQKKIVIKNTVRIDSLNNAAKEKEFIVLKNKIHKNIKSNKVSKMIINQYIPDHNHADSTIDRARHLAIDTNGKSFGERMEWMKDEMQIRIRRGDNEDSLADLGVSIGKMLNDEVKKESSILDKLVPILVRTATSEHVNTEEGITYDDGLIFWYNPEKELIAVVPEAQSSVTPASNNTSEIFSKAVLYPNPAKNKTTLRFTLSEPRTVAFSIHDLLGKRVLDGGSIPETSIGSYEKELNVGELTEGVYLLVITTDKGEQNIQRLVIKK